jgi:hypothetical protein
MTMQDQCVSKFVYTSLRGPLYNVFITMCVTYVMYGTKRDDDIVMNGIISWGGGGGMCNFIQQKCFVFGIFSQNWGLI